MQADYQPGDILVRRKGIVMHKGIVLEDGRVLHNTPRQGEHVCTEREFRAGRRLWVQKLDSKARRRALDAAEQAARRYNLFTNNCEHTVSRATVGQATSPQLQGWIAGAGLALLVLAVVRHPVLAAAGYTLGRSVVKRLRQRKSSA